MKYINRLLKYIRGSRLLILFMTIIITVVIFVGVISFAHINEALLEFRIVKSTTLNNAYYYARTIAYSDLIDKNMEQKMQDMFFSVKNNPIVEEAYTTVVANFFKYEGEIYSIMLYDPGLLKAFPALEKLGIRFSGEENECVLTTRNFKGLKVGDIFIAELYSGGEASSVSLKVSSHLVSPYKQLEFGGSGTYLLAGDMFSNNPGIIMVADEDTLENLKSSVDIKYYPDILFTVKENATKGEIDSLISNLSLEGTVESLDEIIDNTKREIKNSFIHSFIKPGAYLLASLFALFSMIILMVKRKAPEMAVAYLVGASRRSIVAQSLGVCMLVTVIPAAVNIVFIISAPELSWLDAFWGAGIADIYMPPGLAWMVVAYFILVAIISVAAVTVSLAGKAPVDYYRGSTL